jgi:hypothetical protein
MARYPIDGAGKLIEVVIDGPLPSEAAGEASSAPARGSDRWNGEAWEPDLAEAKADARAKISDAAEAARLQFITPGSGKAMSYQEKKDQAIGFLADPLRGQEGHAEEVYPLIYAEVGITDDEAEGVATVIVQRFEMFKQIEAVIGHTEALAQKAVREAGDVAAIDAVTAGLTWPSGEA